jgi:hypothetical protein
MAANVAKQGLAPSEKRRILFDGLKYSIDLHPTSERPVLPTTKVLNKVDDCEIKAKVNKKVTLQMASVALVSGCVCGQIIPSIRLVHDSDIQQ